MMAYGKEKFRSKYKETNDSIKTIKDNYYELDYEYQMLAKKVITTISYINVLKNNIIDFKTKYKKDFLNILEDIKNNLEEILGDKEKEGE